jgi:hypothetical protein
MISMMYGWWVHDQHDVRLVSTWSAGCMAGEFMISMMYGCWVHDQQDVWLVSLWSAWCMTWWVHDQHDVQPGEYMITGCMAGEFMISMMYDLVSSLSTLYIATEYMFNSMYGWWVYDQHDVRLVSTWSQDVWLVNLWSAWCTTWWVHDHRMYGWWVYDQNDVRPGEYIISMMYGWWVHDQQNVRLASTWSAWCTAGEYTIIV